ncbi:MAG: hypothetical protein IJR38_03330, partial [Selenomonadaceae bacterium]|nr:hypothetical protein [Selenomonadaceae bacterium]
MGIERRGKDAQLAKQVLGAILAGGCIVHTGGTAEAATITPGYASDNTVIVNADSYTINGATTSYELSKTEATTFMGGSSGALSSSQVEDSSNNVLTINGINSTTVSVDGGWTLAGNAENNHVIANDATLNQVVGGLNAGAFDVAGNASGNVVDIVGGEIGVLIVGQTGYGDAKNNVANITDATITGSVYGGSATSGTVENNAVNITRGQGGLLVAGGQALNGNALNNSVTVNNSQITTVYGATAYIGNAENNTVNVSGGNYQNIFGALASNGTTANNSVTFTDGTAYSIVGGSSIPVDEGASSISSNNT